MHGQQNIKKLMNNGSITGRCNMLTGSGTHQASYSMGTGDAFQGVKKARA